MAILWKCLRSVGLDDRRAPYAASAVTHTASAPRGSRACLARRRPPSAAWVAAAGLRGGLLLFASSDRKRERRQRRRRPFMRPLVREIAEVGSCFGPRRTALSPSSASHVCRAAGAFLQGQPWSVLGVSRMWLFSIASDQSFGGHQRPAKVRGRRQRQPYSTEARPPAAFPARLEDRWKRSSARPVWCKQPRLRR